MTIKAEETWAYMPVSKQAVLLLTLSVRCRGSHRYSVILSTRMHPMVRTASARISGFGSCESCISTQSVAEPLNFFFEIAVYLTRKWLKVDKGGSMMTPKKVCTRKAVWKACQHCLALTCSFQGVHRHEQQHTSCIDLDGLSRNFEPITLP